MGISHLTKKLALPLLFVVATTVSILLPTWKVSASGTGENYYQSDSSTIIGFGGSYSDTNYLYTPAQFGTTQGKQTIGNLTFTRDSSGKFTSSKVYAMRSSGTTQLTCTMTLSISLNGSSGTITANPDPGSNADAKTCLDLTGLASSITVATFNDQASCEKAGGSWTTNSENNGHMSNSGQGSCSNITAAGAQCVASGQTYTYQGEGNGHASNGPNWVCTGTATQQTVATQYKDASSCSAAGFTWDKSTNQCADQAPPTCDSQWYNPLSSLILCPIFNGVSSLSDWMLNSAIKPMLQVKPVSTDTNNAIYKVWSNFRIYANVILVIVLLVIVFGQVIGGGVMDAYSVRKALPRVLAAAILINLSIYIVNLLIDITNVIGGGLMGLMEAPLKGAGAFHFMLSGGQVATGATFAGVALAGGVGATVLAVVTAGEFLAAAGAWIGLFVLLPLALGLLAAFVTILLRLTLIVALILVAPVAFALWCLPNTEKYFKKWWELLLNMLMAYPIIVAIFAICDILSIIMVNPQTNPTTNPASTAVTTILAFILQFLPLFLIPFAFKMAGGAIGSISGLLMGHGKRGAEAIKGNINDPNSLRNRTKHNFNSAFTRGQAELTRRAEGSRRRSLQRLSRYIAMGDIASRESAVNAEGIKRGEQVKSTGDDRYGRALTSVPLYLDENGKRTTEATGPSGTQRQRALNGKGQAIRESLAGGVYTDTQYKTAKSLYRTNGEKQFWMDYEAGKINSGQTEKFKSNYLKWADQEHFTDNEVQGVYTGVAFSKQNDYLNLKYSGLKRDSGTGKFEYVPVSDMNPSNGMNFDPETGTRGKNDNMVDDLYFKRGPYQTGLLSAEDMNRVYDIKDHYAQLVKDLHGKEASGTITSAETATLRNTREHLERINSLETTWAGEGRGGRAPQSVDEQGVPLGGTYSGLSSGNQGVQDAFKKRAYDQSGNLRRVDIQTGEFIPPPAGRGNGNPPSSGGPSPSGPNRPSPSGGGGSPAPSRPSGPSPSSSGSPSGPRQASRQQSSPNSWEQVIPHAPASTPTVPPVTPSSNPGSRRATREQGPSTPPTFGGNASVGQTSGPQGAVSPNGSRRAIRPQGTPSSTDPSPTPLPPTTIITPTNPSSIDLPPHNNPINPSQQIPGTGPADLPDWMRNGGDGNPPSTT